MSDIIGSLLTNPRHGLASSALPDAPVVDDGPHRSWNRSRRILAAVLRAAGSSVDRLADLVEPPRHPRHHRRAA
jgi:hypothetical protein